MNTGTTAMDKQHYEISGKLTDGISVSVYTTGGAYLFRVNFLAGSTADTRDEVISFFYHNGKGGTFVACHGGNPYVVEIMKFLEQSGYRKNPYFIKG